MSALLALEGVDAGYGRSQILWDVSLTIGAGEVAAVLGRNGVGKTTLLRTIIGQCRADTGGITFDGAAIGTLDAHRRARAGIGYVPQGRHVFPHLTVRENLEVGLSACRGHGDDMARVPDYIFDLFPKLAEIAGRKAGLLSGGEQEQLAIGRALAGRPRLLLLDEPTEGIQPNIVQQIETVLLRVRAELGITILIVEQNLDFAWSFAERYFVMQRGRLIRSGSTRDDKIENITSIITL